MVRLTIPLLTAASLTPLVSADCSVRGPPQPTVPVKVHLDSNYPLAHNTTLQAHDPNIIRANGAFYSFNGSPGIAIHKSDSLDGPWEDMGRALSGSSIIPKEHNERPWAPTALQNDDGTVYLFYTVSQAGCQDSAIGIATTDDIDGGDWKDHGAIVWTGSGPGTAYEPFANSNAIDAQIFVDPTDKQAYLNYGSYWSGLWQLRLSEDWLAVVGGVKDANATHLAKLPEGQNNIEGAFMSFHDGWYYLWYSRGKCCKWEGVPKSGEYVPNAWQADLYRTNKRIDITSASPAPSALQAPLSTSRTSPPQKGAAKSSTHPTTTDRSLHRAG